MCIHKHQETYLQKSELYYNQVCTQINPGWLVHLTGTFSCIRCTKASPPSSSRAKRMRRNTPLRRSFQVAERDGAGDIFKLKIKSRINPLLWCLSKFGLRTLIIKVGNCIKIMRRWVGIKYCQFSNLPSSAPDSVCYYR